MKWQLINNPTSILIEYHLIYKDTPVMVLKYNPIQHSARVSCNEHKRLFFVESAGSLHNKTIIRNEYGLQIGSLGYHSKDGTITLDEKRFNYAVSHDSNAQMCIYENGHENPLISFGFNSIKSDHLPSFTNQKLTSDHNCLLIATCWYLFLPVSKEYIASFTRK